VADCFRREGTELVADGPIRMNGITFDPKDGARLAFDEGARTVSLRDVHLRMGSISLFRGDVTFDVPAGDRLTLARIDLSSFQRTDAPPSGDTEAALDLEGDDSANVKGFDLEGEAVLELTPGASELTGKIKLPRQFADPEGNSLTASVTLRADNENGLRLDAINVNAPRAFIGAVEVRDLSLAFAGRANNDSRSTCNAKTPGMRWDGNARIVELPTPDRLQLEDVGVGFADGRFSYARASWVPGEPGHLIGGGVRVQRIGFSICAGPPTTLEGRIGLTALPDAEGNPSLRIPNAGLKFTADDPWTLRADADEATLERDRVYKFSDLFVQYSSNGAIDFGGQLDFSVGMKGSVGPGDLDAAVDVSARLQGFIEQDRFNATLNTRGCLAGTFTVGAAIPLNGICATVDGVVSSVGFGVCADVAVDQYKLGRIGAGQKWGGQLEFIGASCDLKPWTVQRSSEAPVNQASAGRAVRMPGGRGAVIAVTGDSAPPQVTLRGPGGRELRTPAEPDGSVRGKRHLAFANRATRTTYIVVAKPGRARWRVVPAGGARIKSVRTAGFLPRPVVSARVRGRGRKRTLAYRVRPIRGQRVVFVERARGASRVIGSVKGGGRGKLAFRPAGGPRGRRIDAVVEQSGIPRRRLQVARFTGPKPLRPSLPGRPVVDRVGGDLRVAWKGGTRAERYSARVVLPDGRRLLFVTGSRDRDVRVPAVPRGGRAVVRIVGLDRSNQPGPASQTSYELGRKRHAR
jgi:hypothetical protein